jgi:hypothetical protein
MWCPEKKNMADNSHYLFNKSLPQLRLLGARGGRAYGRNQRARRALTPAAPATPVRRASEQTTAQDIALLEAQFPWLRGAENQLPRNPPARGVHCGELVRAIWPTSGTL